jgi:signal transduction histidine kinase
VISVVDDGLGIDPVELSEVFEPFRRLAAGKQSGSGTGLGLFVVRRIVEAHGGQVRVESEQGRGSTFVVRLPLMEAGATERAHVGRTESQAHA